MRKRVFKNDIGRWPKVYQTGPCRFEVVARHVTPEGLKSLNGISLLVVGIYTIDLVSSTTVTKDNWGFLFVGLLCGFPFAVVLLRYLLLGLPFLTHRTRRIKFDRGKITWWAGMHRHVVGPDVPRAFRIDRHRRASEEARFQQKQEKPAAAVYQASSEVFIDTGEGLMHARLVTAIANDEGGEWAHLLSGALRFVDRQAQVRVEAVVRQQIRVSLD